MAISTISPQEVLERRRQGKAVDIIDVRTPAEYARLHVEGARSVPLDGLDPKALLAQRNGGGAGESGRHEPLYVICESGGRAARACEALQAGGVSDVISVEGGTSAWQRAGLPVVRGATRVISLERQVRIGAGSLVLIGVTLGWLVHPAFFGLSAFIGAGLVFAGVTDWCGMGLMLAKMPWNCSVGCAA